jgi:hypothetical protein
MATPMDAYVLSRTLLIGDGRIGDYQYWYPSNSNGKSNKGSDNKNSHYNNFGSGTSAATPLLLTSSSDQIRSQNHSLTGGSSQSQHQQYQQSQTESQTLQTESSLPMDYPLSPATPGTSLAINPQHQTNDHWLTMAQTPSGSVGGGQHVNNGFTHSNSYGNNGASPLPTPASPLSSLLAPMITPMSPLPMSPSPFGIDTSAGAAGFRYINGTLPMNLPMNNSSMGAPLSVATMATPAVPPLTQHQSQQQHHHQQHVQQTTPSVHPNSHAHPSNHGHAHHHNNSNGGHGHSHTNNSRDHHTAPATPSSVMSADGDDDLNDNRKRRFVRMAAGAACVVCHSQKTKCDGRRYVLSSVHISSDYDKKTHCYLLLLFD